MSQNISLREAERKAFQSTFDDGLWDVLLGCFFLMFAIAPLLGPFLGDFWSSFIFLPFLAAAYIVIWQVRKHVVVPRTGTVKLGRMRKRRMAWFTTVMLCLNLLALILGIWTAANTAQVPGFLPSVVLGTTFLTGFSLAAYFFNISRFFVYGLLASLSLPVGEWLWQQGLVSHHGFPVTYGLCSLIMILTGAVIFIRLLHETRLPLEELPVENG